MHDINDYNKLAKFTRWYPMAEWNQLYLVGIICVDKNFPPEQLVDGSLRNISEELIAGFDPNYIVAEITHAFLGDLDDSDRVVKWSILRKSGPINFSDADIWRAFQRMETEFHPHAQKWPENHLDYKAQDRIGYDETMAAMERILYTALNYY